MPTDNDTVFCPATVDSCYFLSASTNYNNAITRCSALGGAPVQWNSAQEQLVVENYFTVGGLLILAHCMPVLLLSMSMLLRSMQAPAMQASESP
jgi:hypothetical protein